jgi:Skp family chaperone for outer membrane proteins
MVSVFLGSFYMNKKLIVAFIGVAGAGQLVADVAKLQDLNIRTVNIVDIMRDSEEGKKVSVELEQLRKDLTNEFETAQKEYIRDTEELKTKIATLSPEARKQSEERLIAKRRDIENQAQKAEDKLKYTMQNVSERLTIKAQSVIEKYAEENKLDLVLDTASGRALYSSAKVDITGSMIGGMNDEYKKELAQNKTTKPDATKLAAKSPAKAAAAA